MGLNHLEVGRAAVNNRPIQYFFFIFQNQRTVGSYLFWFFQLYNSESENHRFRLFNGIPVMRPQGTSLITSWGLFPFADNRPTLGCGLQKFKPQYFISGPRKNLETSTAFVIIGTSTRSSVACPKERLKSGDHVAVPNVGFPLPWLIPVGREEHLRPERIAVSRSLDIPPRNPLDLSSIPPTLCWNATGNF